MKLYELLQLIPYKDDTEIILAKTFDNFYGYEEIVSNMKTNSFTWNIESWVGKFEKYFDIDVLEIKPDIHHYEYPSLIIILKI